jgi:hypothetical protein
VDAPHERARADHEVDGLREGVGARQVNVPLAGKARDGRHGHKLQRLAARKHERRVGHPARRRRLVLALAAVRPLLLLLLLLLLRLRRRREALLLQQALVLLAGLVCALCCVVTQQHIRLVRGVAAEVKAARLAARVPKLLKVIRCTRVIRRRAAVCSQQLVQGAATARCCCCCCCCRAGGRVDAHCLRLCPGFAVVVSNGHRRGRKATQERAPPLLPQQQLLLLLLMVTCLLAGALDGRLHCDEHECDGAVADDDAALPLVLVLQCRGQGPPSLFGG